MVPIPKTINSPSVFNTNDNAINVNSDMFLDVANIVIPNSSGKGDAIINPAKPSIRYLTNL